MDRIAESAGINKQRIYGYFGSKDGLFDAVLDQTMIEAAEDKPLQPGNTPVNYVGRSFDFHRQHPQLLRLLLWEALSRPVEAALQDPQRQAHYDHKVAAFRATGLSDRDARYTLLMQLALATYTRALPQVTALILGADYSVEELKIELVNAASRLASTESFGSAEDDTTKEPVVAQDRPA